MTKTSELFAKHLNKQLIGKNIEICGVSRFSDLSFKSLKFVNVYNESFINIINSQPSNFFIVDVNYEGKLESPHIISERPRLDFCKIANLFFPLKTLNGIESTAVIGKNVKLGDNIYIGHHTVIEDNVIIGDNSKIFHNVIISRNVFIGNFCVIKSGSIIGQKGFGFERDLNDTLVSFPHYSSVKIGNNVEIGALNTIVSGTLSDTIIGDNVKTDDHVHIAHNTFIDSGSLITACVEISGSVVIGKNVWIGPNSSIVNNVSIGDNSFIGISTSVTKSFDENNFILGVPARAIKNTK
jgi:UDP-3-O-[3-hydroxymyristoyl] glucosamine N-acyltransferase LpxD